MRIAALYDIHGNLPALEAVLTEVGQLAVDAVVIGGDVIAGPMANETLERLQLLDLPVYYIHGNAESEVRRVLAGQEPAALSPYADAEARWLAEALTPTNQAFIATWVDTVTLTVDPMGEVLFCHATPQDDITVFTAETSVERVAALLGTLDVALVVCGHTHMQFDRTVNHVGGGNVRVVNAGSVGMPFGATGAHWLLLDKGVHLRRTNYDRNAAAATIRQLSYPHAAEFADGNVLRSPTVEQAMAMLTMLEAKQIQAD